MSGEISIRLAGPELWERETTRSLAGLDPAEQRFARGIIAALHGRHVGISLRLAVSLARILVSPRHLVEGVWNTVGRCLMRHLNPETEGQSQRMSLRPGQGLVLAANPTYTVHHLAGPLIDLACRHIGRSVLFCEDAVRPPLAPEDYHRYQDQLDEAVEALTLAEPLAGFWLNMAAGTAASSRQGGGAKTGDSGLPSVDPTALTLLLKLRTKPPDPARDLSHRKRADSALPHRPTRHRHEGGLAGIQLSRRPEDVHNLLFSEFLNPKLLLADRLMNTGFLAYQRTPKREKRRDVFMAALLPPAIGSELIRDFIKACWFEALVHLSLLLRRYGFDHSEFRWIQGNPLGHRTDRCFLLDDLPPLPSGFTADTAGFRRRFLTALGWLPDFLDRRHSCDAASQGPWPASPQPELPLDTVLDWGAWAWKGQQEHVCPGRGSPDFGSGEMGTGGNQHPWTRFSRVHLMVFLPSSAGAGLSSLGLDGFRHRLGLPKDPGFGFSITWLPQRLDREGAWAYQAPGRNRRRLFENNPPTSEKALAEGLIRPWFQQWTKEIWGV